jgi:hypothetical protein
MDGITRDRRSLMAWNELGSSGRLNVDPISRRLLDICAMVELGCWRSFDRGRGDYIGDRSIALCRTANCVVEMLCDGCAARPWQY